MPKPDVVRHVVGANTPVHFALHPAIRLTEMMPLMPPICAKKARLLCSLPRAFSLDRP